MTALGGTDGRASDVVWVAAYWEQTARSGGAIRTERMVAALRDAGLTVRVVRGGLTGVPARAVAAAMRWPLGAARAWTPDQARKVRAAQEQGSVVVADHLDAAVVPRLTSRTIVNLHNVESQRSIPRGGSPRIRVDHFIDRRGTPRLEQRVLRSLATIVVVSEADRAALGRGLVVANGTDLPQSVEPPSGRSPVFVGALDYGPNEEGIRWWVTEVWPLLIEPVELAVVGRASTRVLRDLIDHPGLRVVGEVENVSPHLEQASFSVVPLLSGQGSRLKVVESLAHGRAVVTTRKGAEGFDLAEADGVLVVPDADPHALAATVDGLVRDRGRQALLGERARRAGQAFSWPEVTREFSTSVAELLVRS
jgi:glycosyltransferase involved in cell wall biosynthesis